MRLQLMAPRQSLSKGEPQLRIYTAEQAQAILELYRLVAKKKEYERQPGQDRFLLRVLSRALYTAYKDCQAVGLEGEARQVMNGQRESDAPGVPSASREVA